MRDLIHFDPTIDPSEGGGGAPTPPEPGANEFQLDPNEWRQTQEFIRNAAPLMQDMAQRVYAEELQPDPYGQQGFDPYGQQYAPDPYGFQPPIEAFDPNYQAQLIRQEAERLFDDRFEPLRPILNYVTEQATKDIASREYERLQGEVGSFDRNQAALIASGLLGKDGVQPEQAFRAAALQAHAFEEQIRADERAKLEGRLQTLSGAPTASPAGGAAAAPGDTTPVGPGSQKYEIAISRALGRANPVLPTG